MQKYIEMNKDEIASLPKNTVLISCISPIEVHGPHLPVGTDLFIAKEVMEKVIEYCPEYSFVQLPDLPLGGQPVPVNGSLSVKGKYIERIIYDWGMKLKSMGFSFWMLCDNHGGFTHQLALNRASKKLAKKGFNLLIPFLKIMQDMNGSQTIANLPLDAKGGSDDAHAGTNETSLMLYTNATLISEHEKLPLYAPKATLQGRLLTVLFSKEIGRTTDWMLDKSHPSYVGNPSEASYEAGETMINYHRDVSREMLIKSMKGEYNPKYIFPWYTRFILSVLPEW